MEVKIGVTHVNRELMIDTELDAKAIEEKVAAALESGGVLSLTDARGRRIVVPAGRLAYVDVTAGTAGPVGFRS